MAEVLSIAASVVSLVQVLELVRGSITIIRGIKNAPAEWGRIATNSEATGQIIAEIENLIQRISPIPRRPSDPPSQLLYDQLSVMKADFDLLRGLTNRKMAANTVSARWKIRFKWMGGSEKRLLEVYGRLETRLLLTISLLTMYSSFEGQLSSRRTQQDLDALARQLTRRGSDPLTTQAFPRQLSSDTSRVLTSVAGSVTVCANLLEDIGPDLRQLASVQDGFSRAGSPRRRLGWLRSQIHTLLLEVSSGSLCDHSADIRPITASHTNHSEPPSLLLRTRLPEHSLVNPLSRSTLYYFLKQFSIVETVPAELLSPQPERGNPNHRIAIMLLNYQPSEKLGNNTQIDSFTRSRLYVAPSKSVADKQKYMGTVVQFFEVSGTQPQLWRSLTSFGIHPNDSPVFGQIKSGAILEVQRLFSLGLVGPNDRDQDGNTLLWHCLKADNNYSMCELLLRAGASASDCNIRGDHALASLIMHLSLQGEPLTEYRLKVLDLILAHSDKDPSRTAEPTGTLPYKSRNGVQLAPAGIVHCATPRRAGSTSWVSQLPTLLQRFGNHFGVTASLREGPYLPGSFNNSSSGSGTYTLDLELADKNGNTALLYSLYYHPTLLVLETGTYLVDVGANMKAKNKFGEGALHLLCRRLSACNVPNLSDEVKRGAVSLMSRFIKAGCDPVEPNKVGSTSIDAAMTPVAWPLFCRALNEVGRDVRAEMKFLDIASGVSWVEEELETLVEQKITEFRERKAQGVMEILKCYPPDEHCQGGSGVLTPPSCYICGGGPDLFKRPQPFDEFYSDVANELGHGLHMVKYHHPDLRDCLLVQEEDSCFPLDYDPTRPGEDGLMDMKRLKERSWRRYVAACLWERGLLI